MDIASILDSAKKTILEDGEHAPTLFVENQQGDLTMVYFADLPAITTQKQCMLFGLGREHGIAHPGNPVAKLYFISEAWVSFVQKGKKPRYSAPELDPSKKEMLIILSLDVLTGQQGLHRFEMLRDGSGAFMDLLVLTDEWEAITDRLLPAFLAGALSASYSDRELTEMLLSERG